MNPTRLLAAALALASLPALAQPVTPPSEGLPSLTPRVFTSTGPTRVALPSIPRQPLTGFGPPPRTYVVPAERESVVEPFEAPVEALPSISITAPVAPPVQARRVRTVRLEGALGSYLARSGRLDLQAAGASGLFFVDADADGLSPGDAYVASDRLSVRAGGQSFAAGRLRIEGVGQFGSYTLPGTAVLDRRTRSALGTTVGLSGLGEVPYDVKIGYTQSRLSDVTGETNEGRIDTEARAGLAGNHVRLDATGGASGQGAGFGSGLGDVFYATGGLAYATSRADGARLVVGVRGLLANAADAGGTDTQAVGPVIDARLPFRAGALYLTNTPRLDVRSLAELTAFNPVVAQGVVVAPDVLPIDAQGGLELGRTEARVRFYGLATYSPSRLIFEGTTGFLSEAYVGAATVGGGADVTLGSVEGVAVSATVEARAARVNAGDGGGDLPFYAPIVARAGVQAPFARGRGRAGLTASVESERPYDRFSDANAYRFSLVGFDFRYDVGGALAVVGHAERILGTVQRWPGFREAPFTAVLGLRLTR